MKRILLILIGIGAVSGCSHLKKEHRKATENVATTDVGYITVSRFNSPASRLAVPRNGTSLRQVVAIARDSSGLTETEQAILNSPKVLTQLSGLSLDSGDVAASAMARGEEWFILIRGQRRYFFPEDVIANTQAGRVLIFPGDAVVSIPFNGGISSGGLWIPDAEDDTDKNRRDATRIAVTAISEATGEQNISLEGTAKSNSSDLPFGTTEEVNIWDVVLVTRTDGQFLDELFVIPARSNYNAWNPGRSAFADIRLLDGDVVEAILAEDHPLVRAGISRSAMARVAQLQ